MYRQLEEIPAGQEQHRAPGTSNRLRAALKRESQPGSLQSGAAETTAALNFRPEASDKRRSAETPLQSEWRFVLQAQIFLGCADFCLSEFTGKRIPKVTANFLPHLPVLRLRCSIRVAY